MAEETKDAVVEESPLLTVFRKEAHDTMLSRINLATAFKLTPQELRTEIENFVFEFAQERRAQITKREQVTIARELVDDMIGLGPLERLLDDEAISDIVVNGPFQIYVEKGGLMQLVPIKFRDDATLCRLHNVLRTGLVVVLTHRVLFVMPVFLMVAVLI